MTPLAESLDLLDAAIYGDLFDCAVSFEELWLYSRSRLTREELAARLAEPAIARVLRQESGFYFLAGRQHLVGLRVDGQQRARVLRRRAEQVAAFLRHTPFVRGVFLTGSAAADSAQPDADVDLLVVVADRRISSVFALLGSLSRLLSRRIFCPNYYLSDAHLTLQRRDHYVARELAQALSLSGDTTDLRARNSWIHDYLPNLPERVSPASAASRPVSRLARLLEMPLRGRVGDWIENKARGLALARLAVHYGLEQRVVPEDVERQVEAGVELRFHASPFADNILGRYERRRAEIAAALGPEPAAASEPCASAAR